MRKIGPILLLFAGVVVLMNCEKDDPLRDSEPKPPSQPDDSTVETTPYELDLPPHIQRSLGDMPVPDDNPLTKEGVKLGRMLFYDPILSRDSSMSCATCHKQENAFASNEKFNMGITGATGFRNAMALMNLAWGDGFNWDNSAPTLEEQALEPVVNPAEMHESWPHAVKKLKRSDFYPEHFDNAFGDQEITRHLTAKAIAQFVRSLTSFNAKIDRFVQGQASLTPSERRGRALFNTEEGDCFHCHGSANANPLFTSNEFLNNGLDSMGPDQYNFNDRGLGAVTGVKSDRGKFKTPTLRNIELTAPYMHDGRFETLKAVMDFYSDSLQPASNVDGDILKHLPRSQNGYYNSGGMDLTEQEKQDLVNYLETFTDTSFVNDPRYSDPFE